ncbi:MAG: 1,4-alpha-glucan branching protein GlgB, partial [Clostridia bacterium]|nr:1,4-alpha-glucan branching protein GlgB [Clostridia bacterium]
MPDHDTLAPYLFHQGTNYRSFEYLGVHKEGERYAFRVWAPHANAVFVVGDFNGWSERDPLVRITDGEIFQGFVAADRFGEGAAYKFKLITPNGERFKADPYAFHAEVSPATASVYADIDGYQWRDAGWMARRAKKMTPDRFYEQPINIYEMHPGSFKRHEDGSYYTYTELARELPSYVKAMGYTHVELMPVMEHPFDGSWGYQVTGYYAPTSRFGTPHEFMGLVDALHEAGIGVILDWVPAHFPKDAHGLYEFDGQPLYEYQGRDRMEHKGWGTRCFDVGREEVQSFLVSNATFWVEKYHADGLRVDAVASMLYLDYDRTPEEWVPNVHGDNRNLEAIAFFQKLNSHMRGLHPDVLMIAEESTAYGNLTTFENGGLGFSMKWNMGWMNDTLDYKTEDYYFRRFHHTRTTFSLTYSFNERYVLPVSHDEVVHGKLSLLDRSPGDYWRKFADTRVILAYMMTHPGKKLLFMGSEYGPFREWDFENELEWFMLKYPAHADMQHYVAALNHFYLKNPPLYEIDGSWSGFQWIDANNSEQSILSYRRIDKRGREL